MKRVILYAAVVLATVTAVIALWQFRLVLLLFALSLFVAAAIRPAVERLSRFGLNRGAAQITFYVVALGGVALFAVLAGNVLLGELNQVANRATIAYERLHQAWEQGSSWQQTAVQSLPPPFTLSTAFETDLDEMVPAVVSVVRGLGSALGGLLLTLALSIYWSVDQNRFERLWLSLLPARRRAYTRTSWRQIEAAVGSYLRSQTVQSVLAALLLGLGGVALGAPYPLTLALAGAVATFIPLFGGLLAAGAAFALGVFGGPWVAVTTAGYTLVVFLALELLVEPRLWARERRSFLLIILTIIPLLEAFGLWGLILAPVLAATLEVVIGQVYRAALTRQSTAVQFQDLQTRFQNLAEKMSTAPEEDALFELRDLQRRLATLLAESQPVGMPATTDRPPG